MLSYHGPYNQEREGDKINNSQSDYYSHHKNYKVESIPDQKSSIPVHMISSDVKENINHNNNHLNGNKNGQEMINYKRRDTDTNNSNGDTPSSPGMEIKVVNNGKQYVDIQDDKHMMIEGKNRSGHLVEKWFKPLVAECIGTMFLVYLGTLSSVAELGITGAAWVHGFTLATIIAVFGNVSGGHVNPLVTIGLALTSNFGFKKMIFYILAQFLGALIASGLFYLSMAVSRFDGATGGMITYNLADNVLGGVFICEIFLTTFLILVVLIIVVGSPGAKYQEPHTPLVIGMVVGIALIACIFAGGTVSGPALNPVRLLGPAIVYNLARGVNLWKQQYVYYVAELLGCFIAVIVYKFVLGGPNTKPKCYL